MSPEIHLALTKKIREYNLDEYWLQDRIYSEPSILGLGDLERVSKEKTQSMGGRLDILLKDPEDDSMYEVEVMLGETDESHIIRTIEYWDLEKRRWPRRNHTAVLIAERISHRFYNVIYLLSQSIPIIGIQVSLVDVDGKVGLHFTKIIDSYEEPDVETEEERPEYDKAYWEKACPQVVKLAGAFESLAASLLENVKLRFLQNYVALTICDIDRVWVRERKGGKSLVEFRMDRDAIEEIAQELEQKGINTRVKYDEYLHINMTSEDFSNHCDEIKKILAGLYKRGLSKKNISSPVPVTS